MERDSESGYLWKGIAPQNVIACLIGVQCRLILYLFTLIINYKLCKN